MSDIETRQALITACRILRVHEEYLCGLHRNLVALFDALSREHPELEKIHAEEMAKIREFPASEQLLRGLDRLLQQLQTS